MAAITYPIAGADENESVEVRGAAARAAAVRSRRSTGGGRRGARASLFAGDGQLRRPAPPVRLTAVPLVAHDDVAPLRPRHVRPLVATTRHLVAVAEPVRTARPDAGSVTANHCPTEATFRRRRLTAAALFLGALLTGSWVLGALGGGPLAASESGSSSTPTASRIELQVQPVSRSTYVVAQGDTLWSIARHLQPEGDVRPVVDALAATRHGRPLEVGETIVLP